MGGLLSGISEPELRSSVQYRFLAVGVPVILDDLGAPFYFDTGFNGWLSKVDAAAIGAECGAQKTGLVLVGTKYLERFKTVLFDFVNNMVVFDSDPSSYAACATAPFRSHPGFYGPLFFLRVESAEHKAMGFVDTGSRWTYAYRGLSEAIKQCESSSYAGGELVSPTPCGLSAPPRVKVSVQGQVIELKRVRYEISIDGEFSVDEIYASCSGDNRVMNGFADLSLGLDFLLRKRLLIDFVNKTHSICF